MLKRIFIATVMITAIAPCVWASDAHCPSDLEKPTPAEEASVFLHIDRTSYPLNGSMVIDAGIINGGSNPIYVYGWISWGYGGGLIIRIRDDNGKELAPVLRDDTMLPPPRKNDNANMFVKLKDGGDFFGTRREIAVADLVKSPGRYTLQIEYRSPLSCRFVSGSLRSLPALWHEDDGIVSKQVSFEVTARQQH